MIFLRLFFEFFTAGLFAIGGGMATVPFLQRMGEATAWFTDAELANMIAISESTPGPIGVNMATYVGNTVAGIPGGIIATVGLVTPSVIVILIVAAILEKFRDNKFVNAAFYGLRAASVGLIAAAAASIVITIVNVGVNWMYGVLAAVLLALTNIKATKKLHPICFIAFSAIVGVVFAL